MEVLEITAKLRQELILYFRQFMDEDSMRWSRNCLSSINKKVMETTDFSYKIKVYNLYSNFKRYYENYVDGVWAGYLLYSLYCITTQLELDVNVEELKGLKQFTEIIDLNDFSEVTKKDIDALDAITSKMIQESYISGVKPEGAWMCGIYTLTSTSCYN